MTPPTPYTNPQMLHPGLREIWTGIPKDVRGENPSWEQGPEGEWILMFGVGFNATHNWAIGQNREGTKFYRKCSGENLIPFTDLRPGEWYELPYVVEIDDELISPYEAAEKAEVYRDGYVDERDWFESWPGRLQEKVSVSRPYWTVSSSVKEIYSGYCGHW